MKQYFSKEERERRSISMLGINNPNFGSTEKFLNTMAKRRGANHWNWKGGITPNNEKLRKCLEYKRWRRAVFERDNYTCQFCEKKNEVSGQLQADHIKPFAYYPELRFELDNGRTLCIGCHKTTSTYKKHFKIYKQ